MKDDHNSDEITIFQIKTNTGFNKIFRHYKSHIISSILNNRPILTLDQWYWRAKEQKILTSRTFEKYLRTVNIDVIVPTSSGVEIKDLK